MWEKYADCHRGFCVGFDTDKMFASFRCGCGYVQYKEDIPPIDFVKDSIDEKIIKTVYCKEKKWQIEKEYRFHRMWQDNETVNRNCRLRKDTIKEIIIGNRMPRSFVAEIIEQTKEKYTNIILRHEDGNLITE